MKLEEIRRKLIESGWHSGWSFGENLRGCFDPLCVYKKYSFGKDLNRCIYLVIKTDNTFVFSPSLSLKYSINVNDIKEILADEKEYRIDCFDGYVRTIRFQGDNSFLFSSEKVQKETAPALPSIENIGSFYFYVWKRNKSFFSSKDFNKRFESIEEVWSLLQSQTKEEQEINEYRITLYRKKTAEDIKRIDDELKKWGYGDTSRFGKKDNEEYLNPYKSGLEPY